MQAKAGLYSVLISIVPILLWGAYFYYKNPRKQALSEILKIFILGVFSILPVLIFHRWLLDELVLRLFQLWPGFQNPLAGGLLELGLLLLFIFFFILIFAFLHSAQLRFFYHLPWYQNFSTIYKRLYNLTPILLFFVIFLLLELFFNNAKGESFVLSLAGSTIIFAVLEEYFKYIINPFLVYKKVNSVGTAMVHALYVGLAFAFFENILFFSSHWEADGFFELVTYRSFFTTLMHVGASGIIGYFYGLSLFGEAILANHEIEKSEYQIPSWLRSWLKKTTVYKSMLITQGFFLASLIHAIFNLLIYLDKTYLAAILALIVVFSILYLLNATLSQVQYGLIGTRAMPEEDFERLRLQISVLQHVKEIQKERIAQL